MNKRAISIILMLAMLFALAVPAAVDGVSASATSQTVTVNGEAVAVEALQHRGQQLL